MAEELEVLDESVDPVVVEADDNGDLIMTLASGGLVFAVFVIGGTLATGIMTGLTSALGFGFLIYKLRKHHPKFWNFMMDHPLGTDVVVSGGFLVLLAPMTATGIIAGASAAVFASAGISMASRFLGKVQGVGSIKLPEFKFKEGGIFNVRKVQA